MKYKIKLFVYKNIFKIIRDLGGYKVYKYIQHNILKKNDNILLEDFKAIYFFVPKVAYSSIRSAFLKTIKTKNNKFPSIQKNKVNKYKNYYKFSFVRNPYDRLVSCYKDKIKLSNENNAGFINGVMNEFHTVGNFQVGMSFKNFVKEICKIPDSKADLHFVSQYTFFTNKKGELFLDFIGKFENLEEDFNNVMNKIGVKGIKLPHHNKTIHKNYKEYYDEETKKLVAERYKKDLELFLYDF